MLPFNSKVQSVTEITNSIKHTLETEFDFVVVTGEISNFKPHFASGHWYFTLKDENAQISCNMWVSYNAKVTFKPTDGMKVIVSGKLNVYPPRGSYAIDCRTMVVAGEGELLAAFERLKKRLEAEGLFDKQYKKELKKYPKKIGVITAVDSAAMKDMVRTATRRYPLVEIIVIPTRMQGEGAAEDVVNSISIFNKRNDIDTILIARGGGSIEDLWAFNEEIVARAIFNSKIPIITGIGHETDYTIADFVSDVRASTPTAAMELATPDRNEYENILDYFLTQQGTILLNNLLQYKSTINRLIDSYGFRVINSNIKNNFNTLDNLIYKMTNNLENKIVRLKNKLEISENKIIHNNINNILEKGYTLVLQNNKLVKRQKDFDNNLKSKIKFFDGEIEVN